MRYRKIKRCKDLAVSEIALGCEGFLGKSEEEYLQMIDCAQKLGINFIDMYTPNPQFQKYLGEALAGRRKAFVLQGHLCSVWENEEYLRTRNLEKVKRAFEDQLKHLQTDYLDIGMIHYVDAMDDWKEVAENGILEYCQNLKEEGRIHAIGMSSHNPEVAAEAVRTGAVDVLMFSVNAAYDMQPSNEDVDELFKRENYREGMGIHPERAALYELCEREGVAIDVMKAFGGGDMLKEELSPFGVAFTEAQCIEYCLTRPAVVAVMAGCHSVSEIQKAAAYLNASTEEKDYATVLGKMEKFQFQGNCMYCGHCAPCSVGISVADVNKYLNLCLAQKMVPETVADHYRLLPHHASECIACGKCEKNCPFGVEIIEKMKKAAEVFGY